MLAPAPNSGVLVLPTTIAPAARTRGDQAFVLRRDMIAEDHAAIGGAQAGGLLQVLDADRQAVQRRQGIAAQHRRVGCLCAGTGAVEVARHHGVDGMIDRLDPGDAAFQQFARRQTFRADQPRARSTAVRSQGSVMAQ